ncbi:MAG: hypothetical protein Q8Q23_00595 [bacterium]|nr:hypothetical protein [bacterium]
MKFRTERKDGQEDEKSCVSDISYGTIHCFRIYGGTAIPDC